MDKRTKRTQAGLIARELNWKLLIIKGKKSKILSTNCCHLILLFNIFVIMIVLYVRRHH